MCYSFGLVFAALYPHLSRGPRAGFPLFDRIAGFRSTSGTGPRHGLKELASWVLRDPNSTSPKI